MQIIFTSQPLTILLCFILWPVFQISAAIICNHLPDKYFSPSSIVYKTRTWERSGQIYNQIFRIRKWKKFLPDGGAVIKGGYKKKSMADFSSDNLNKFLVESCRAELTHLLAITPFWVFGFFVPPQVILIMLLYAIAVNVPCIIAQRYNRPKILMILKKFE